ncbi:hypothetical protein ACNJYA_10380 [Bradyrhizobium sp. DASA03068]|uniref:hypothetical protein n=1 Tax=Bradyrhizobium sp. BLXBL-01 TaxID=3395915 RepID=UPI003F6F6A60
MVIQHGLQRLLEQNLHELLKQVKWHGDVGGREPVLEAGEVHVVAVGRRKQGWTAPK